MINSEQLSTSICVGSSVSCFAVVSMWLKFSLSFYHHLSYNVYVIQDTLLCIAECKVHLHPLLFVCESFPVTLKMYFLCFDRSLLPEGSIPDTTASADPLSVSADNGFSSHYCSDYSDVRYHRSHFSGY